MDNETIPALLKAIDARPYQKRLLDDRETVCVFPDEWARIREDVLTVPAPAGTYTAVDDALGLVKVELRLPRELYADLQARAAAEGLAVPAWMRQALAEFADVLDVEAAQKSMETEYDPGPNVWLETQQGGGKG